jgi:hypothetical protein
LATPGWEAGRRRALAAVRGALAVAVGRAGVLGVAASVPVALVELLTEAVPVVMAAVTVGSAISVMTSVGVLMLRVLVGAVALVSGGAP